MNKNNETQKRKRRENNNKNTTKKIKEIINNCIVCGGEIKKGQKFCQKCYHEIKKYTDENAKNIYIEDISEDFLKSISNKYNNYEKKEDKETGIKYIEMTYVYNYFRDNVIRNIDVTFILLALFVVLMGRAYEVNIFLAMLTVVLYVGVCYLKNEYYKRKKKGTVIRFFSNMMIKSSKLVIDKREKVEYKKILDIKQYKKFKFLPTTLFFEDENSNRILGRGVSIEDVYKLDEFVPLLVGITGYTAPKENASKSVEDLLKESVDTIKKSLFNSKDKNKNENTQTKNDK